MHTIIDQAQMAKRSRPTALDILEAVLDSDDDEYDINTNGSDDSDLQYNSELEEYCNTVGGMDSNNKMNDGDGN